MTEGDVLAIQVAVQFPLVVGLSWWVMARDVRELARHRDAALKRTLRVFDERVRDGLGPWRNRFAFEPDPATTHARTWNDATIGVAALACAPLCVFAHFVISRRSPWGVALGIDHTVGILVVLELVAQAVDLLLAS